jgi:hypothetical protein
MLVTDFAYREMEMRANGLTDRIAASVRRLFRLPSPVVATPEGLAAEAPPLHLLATDSGEHLSTRTGAERPLAAPDFRWRRHPQLRRRVSDAVPSDSEDLERGARSAAVRGLFLARSGRFAEARDAFAIAAAEPSVDLTRIPGFWDLSRAGMVAAMHAYEDASRFREAAALGARLRLMHRPRSISVLPPAANRRRAATGQ